MKQPAQVSSHPDVCRAVEALRVALTTHHHVRDFQFHVEVQGHIIAEWNGLNREIVPVARDMADVS